LQAIQSDWDVPGLAVGITAGDAIVEYDLDDLAWQLLMAGQDKLALQVSDLNLQEFAGRVDG
jgi:hypothetical protein